MPIDDYLLTRESENYSQSSEKGDSTTTREKPVVPLTQFLEKFKFIHNAKTFPLLFQANYDKNFNAKTKIKTMERRR